VNHIVVKGSWKEIGYDLATIGKNESRNPVTLRKHTITWHGLLWWLLCR